MLRRYRLTIGIIAVFVVVAIAALLARALMATESEQARVFELIQAQARGDANGVLARLPTCANEPACVAMTRARVSRLKQPGRVQLLNYEPSIRIALTREIGAARIAWRSGDALPVVQCVRVHREGPLSGGQVELLAMSDPIDREGNCRT